MKTPLFDADNLTKVEESGIIAVLEVESASNAVAAVDALLAGGITAIELTLRTAAAIDSIKAIATNRPEMTIGVGTVIFPGQIEQIIEVGAHFAVSPGFNPVIVDEARRCGLSFAPGIATPSELEGAVSKGCTLLKLFPAELLGGVEYLRSMINPYAYLGLSYIPLGGVNLENLTKWAALKPVVAVGGTWISPRTLIAEKNWSEITQRATEAKQTWCEARSVV
ncbi:MAG: bifunctional 4-hydroxy-2-oxoglutarate aldolase/2-dehydro-3-deoxy-phosphogluconate aldolase [Sphaerochaeta sp.]|jgi:2-dehydro-3-deoxyphosphogluconate aldolase/(4S)-4-hydroxy-2-oxoglutarate aldolase|nr:bifunctional 4-hydroxy-2-oxoglutarate aldolase/2-dehydro-3-deoxy-phosphogluconate aldolase [Sphaerochaeta sp.]